MYHSAVEQQAEEQYTSSKPHREPHHDIHIGETRKIMGLRAPPGSGLQFKASDLSHRFASTKGVQVPTVFVVLSPSEKLLYKFTVLEDQQNITNTFSLQVLQDCTYDLPWSSCVFRYERCNNRKLPLS
ncbi:hypothetical protein CRM22_005352 [Opisthorchis felineus]|uniref:Uncharacterized protein n=1 Tax=Opisthorchis felineus TaxID=147828 RepID=A0A4S2LRK4_OPIFE|nr:hypothetical protein CRM22_005352 [Opisthorchis felineus]